MPEALLAKPCIRSPQGLNSTYAADSSLALPHPVGGEPVHCGPPVGIGSLPQRFIPPLGLDSCGWSEGGCMGLAWLVPGAGVRLCAIRQFAADACHRVEPG